MYTSYNSKKSSRKTGRTILMSLLLIIVVVMCVMTIGARFNNQTVDVNPVAVDEPVATVAPEVIVLPTAAPAATPAPVGAVFPAQASEPVEQFPIGVLNGNSGLGPYWVNPQKAELTVEPDQVGHISSLAPYADNGWFVLSQHTVDSIDESQLVEETIYGASLPNVGDANMRSEDHGIEGGALARALYSYVERVDGTAHTLKAEEYDRDIHILVGFLKVGEANNEYWTVWENHQFGYYTLCYVKAGSAPVVEQPTWTAPQQPQQPQPQDPQPQDPTPVDVDPEPVWEDPTEPTPVQPTEEPWDPSFNWNVDPAPVWEEPTTPPAVVVPTQDWDPAFNFEGNTDPAPVWESTNVDPAPVWENVSAPAEPAAPAVVDSWDAGFNFGGSTEVYTSYAAPVVEAAPVFEAPSVSYDPAPVFESADTGSSSSSASADEGWDSGFNF